VSPLRGRSGAAAHGRSHSTRPAAQASAHREDARVKKRARPAARTARRPAARRPSRAVAAAPVTSAELRALPGERDRRMRTMTKAAVGKQRTVARQRGARPAQGGPAPLRWNPEPEDVQRSVAQLVLTIVEFLRRLMERQAIRRMEQKTLTRKEVE